MLSKTFITLAISGLLAFSSFQAQAVSQTLRAQTIETQFEDQTLQLNENTKWIIFSTNKASSGMVRDAFEAQKIDTKSLESMKAIYVADVHSMPSFITKMFALPKMRDYAFAIGLDLEGDMTRNWPKEEDTVMVYTLEGLAIKKVSSFRDSDSFQKFLLEAVIPK